MCTSLRIMPFVEWHIILPYFFLYALFSQACFSFTFDFRLKILLDSFSIFSDKKTYILRRSCHYFGIAWASKSVDFAMFACQWPCFCIEIRRLKLCIRVPRLFGDFMFIACC